MSHTRTEAAAQGSLFSSLRESLVPSWGRSAVGTGSSTNTEEDGQQQRAPPGRGRTNAAELLSARRYSLATAQLVEESRPGSVYAKRGHTTGVNSLSVSAAHNASAPNCRNDPPPTHASINHVRRLSSQTLRAAKSSQEVRRASGSSVNSAQQEPPPRRFVRHSSNPVGFDADTTSVQGSSRHNPSQAGAGSRQSSFGSLVSIKMFYSGGGVLSECQPDTTDQQQQQPDPVQTPRWGGHVKHQFDQLNVFDLTRHQLAAVLYFLGVFFLVMSASGGSGGGGDTARLVKFGSCFLIGNILLLSAMGLGQPVAEQAAHMADDMRAAPLAVYCTLLLLLPLMALTHKFQFLALGVLCLVSSNVTYCVMSISVTRRALHKCCQAVTDIH